MYKVVFIDEQNDDIEAFKDYVDANSDIQLNVEYLLPKETLEEMIEEIFNHNPDAVIVDYMLNEIKELIKYNVPYNGVELIHHLLSVRENFPCFVMTSFDDDAIKSIDDVNKVYVKGILHGKEKNGSAKANFLQRVEKQILHYKMRVEEAEKRILELISLRDDGKATIQEEEELIRLDRFVEKSIDKRYALPDDYRTVSNTKRLDEISSKIDELINKMEEKNGK